MEDRQDKTQLLVSIKKTSMLKLKTVSFKLNRTHVDLIEEMIDSCYQKYKSDIIDDLLK